VSERAPVPVSRPLRYAVVSSVSRGYASRFLEAAASRRDRAELVGLVFCHAAPRPDDGRKRLERKLRKVRRIGVLGALNGLRMRRWYGDAVADRLGLRDVRETARSLGVPVVEIERFGDPAAKAALAALDCDVAVSMGNAYIPRSFFSIPRRGMLNIHHELLPEYRGAQTALWQIHDGSASSGFTIHEINETIDAGRLLVRREVPISFGATLRDTVVATTAAIQLASIDGLLELLDDFDDRLERATPNVGGRMFTTPGLGAMLRIYRNHSRLRSRAARAGR